MGASLSVSSIYRLIQARKHAHEYSDNGVKEETVATSANEEAPNNRFLLPSTSAQQKNKRVKLIYSLADEEDSSSIHRGHHTFFSSSTSLPVNVPPPRIQRAHSDSQELEVETVNECEQSREEAAHAFLPAHVEKCISELSVPSNELSRKVSANLKIRCVGTCVLRARSDSFPPPCSG